MNADKETMYELFMQAPAAIGVARGPDHVFEFANPRYLKLVGKTKKIVGMKVSDVFPELVSQGFIDLLDGVFKTGQPFIGNEIPIELDELGSGTLVKHFLNFVYQPVKDSTGKTTGIMAHAVDVTEQVEARQKIQEGETRYRTLFDSIDQGISIIEMVFNKKGQPIDYRFIEVNDVFEHQTGLKNVIGKLARTAIPNLEDYWVETYGAVAKTGKSVRFVEHSTALGKWFNVHASRSGGPDSNMVAILFTDISESKAAEDALRLSEEQNRIVIETLEEGVAVLDASGTIISANKNAEKLLGLTIKQLRGRNPLDPRWKSIHEDGSTMPGSEHAPQQVLLTKKAQINQTMGIHKPDGELTWLTVNAQPIMHNNELTGVVTSFFDTTARKKIEQALQDELQITDTLTKFTTSCLFMIDGVGLITYMNPAAVKVTGYTLNECLGKPLHDLIHHSYPDGKKFPATECHLYLTYRIGKASPLKEVEFFRKNGKAFPALVSGTPIQDVHGVTKTTVVEFRDITVDKQTLKTLAESEARLRFMSESMPQKVFTANPDGEIDYFNNEWMEYTGLSFEQIRDWGWIQFVHPDDIENNAQVWKKSLELGKPFKIEHRFKRFDGSYHWHLSRARPMRDTNGNIIKWFGSNTDIEDIKNATQRNRELERVATALKEQRTQLVALNEAKDDFISLASHQLRTPASATKQFLGMVLEGYAGEVKPEQEQLLKRAHETNERQINIVNDLLNVALVDSGKIKLQKSEVDLVQLLKVVLADQTDKFNAREQTVTFKCPKSAVLANVDANRFRMVLDNLIDNACKYTPTGKNVTVTLSKIKHQASISIHDQGVGMKNKDMDKLFKKFSRLDNPLSASAGGSGLGLYLVKNIVHLHDGTIDVESTPGKGSTFTIVLPL